MEINRRGEAVRLGLLGQFDPFDDGFGIGIPAGSGLSNLFLSRMNATPTTTPSAGSAGFLSTLLGGVGNLFTSFFAPVAGGVQDQLTEGILARTRGLIVPSSPGKPPVAPASRFTLSTPAMIGLAAAGGLVLVVALRKGRK